ncbi:aspartate aminotransferase family protein [Methanoplanus limicola]|uniref:Aminotransferase class-III n=1 Tax=Methanoplanus limicola DSM 2279 TaxID=937775 RepID=H1YXB3_9EURY|nr:aminotransferase class III-fold pyridoxal phosphate-dependent enzyme [Methanoplanus limicola]EHQ36850.1 aminotransferase class-III [Methanoplanus limicola DSM 2279]
MAEYMFNQNPVDVSEVDTKYRQIKTKLPVPDSIVLLEVLDKYECRSMHGQYPIIWDKAKDFQVYDKYGNCWIDFTSTIFVANAGHSNPAIKAKIKEVMDSDLLHSYTYITEIRINYLKKLIEFVPEYLEKAFLLSSGTEATECALKLIRMHGAKIGKRKGGVVSFNGSMHGRTLGAQMLGGNPESRSWIGYEDPNIHRLPFPYPWLAESIGDEDNFWKSKFHEDIKSLITAGVDPKKDLAGFIIESYIGWGAILLPKSYIQELVKYAGENKILVVFDEIQGGFGRTGKLFTYQHYEVEPDMICCGKGISSSLPLSAVIGRKEIMDIPEIGSMSSTHSANPLCCAAGLANIEVIESMNLIAEAKRKGILLFERLNQIKAKYPDYISYVLGDGLIAGVIFINPETGEPDSEIASRIAEKAMQKGLLLVHTGRESIKIGPPLTITDDALYEGLDVFEESIFEIIYE